MCSGGMVHFFGEPYLFLIVYFIYILCSLDRPPIGFFDFVGFRIVLSPDVLFIFSSNYLILKFDCFLMKLVGLILDSLGVFSSRKFVNYSVRNLLDLLYSIYGGGVFMIDSSSTYCEDSSLYRCFWGFLFFFRRSARLFFHLL